MEMDIIKDIDIVCKITVNDTNTYESKNVFLNMLMYLPWKRDHLLETYSSTMTLEAIKNHQNRNGIKN